MYTELFIGLPVFRYPCLLLGSESELGWAGDTVMGVIHIQKATEAQKMNEMMQNVAHYRSN